MTTVTASPKFQVVIPPDVRRRLGLRPGAQLDVVAPNGILRLVPVRSPALLRGIAHGVDTRIEREPDLPP